MRYSLMYSLNPCDHTWVSNDTIYSWRQYLKSELFRQRNMLSDYSGKSLTTCDMHEGIITRANVPKSVAWHFMIFNPINCFLLSREEHQLHGHEREWAIQKSYERYGRDVVREWYYNLPFKSRPFELL